MINKVKINKKVKIKCKITLYYLSDHAKFNIQFYSALISSRFGDIYFTLLRSLSYISNLSEKISKTINLLISAE